MKPSLSAALLLFAFILRICEAQPTGCAGLQSQFLKDDPTAQAIASGTLTNYSIDDFTLRLGDPLPGASTDVFAYRLLSAIRELGYLPGAQTSGGEDVGAELLNKFQRINGLTESPIITAGTLLAIDAALARREMLDQETAQDFPLFSMIPEAPPNEPSRTHLAALLDADFRALPPRLSAWNTQNFYSYANGQLGSIAADASGGARFCSTVYWDVFSPDSCATIGTTMGLYDDFTSGATYLHEYAHYLDQNIFGLLQSPGLSAGVIDTTDFYAISYDISDSIKSSFGSTLYRARRDPATSGGAEFVSSYAVGWGTDPYLTAYEDFAESFTLYVTGGRVFRKLASEHTYLKQKYDWLKQNVFEGIEYDTGSLTGLANAQTNPLGGDGIAVFNVIEYLLADPDAVWEQDFPHYPATPQPPRLRMRPTGRPDRSCQAKW